MKPKLTKLRPDRVSLYWDRKGDKKHIGYYFPGQEIVTTVHGRYSISSRQNLDNKTIDTRNRMHDRRMHAAYSTEDFVYHGE